LTDQGSPPRPPARQPDLGRRGYDRQPMSDRQPIADRPRTDRPRPERLRRPDRHERPPGWDQYGPDTDTELPPWAGPSVHATRPGGTRLRPPAARPDDYEPGDYADPWAGEEPPEWPEEVPRPAAAADPVPPEAGRRSGRRAAAARLRKSRRRVLRWTGVAIVVCVIAAGVAAIVTHHSTPKLPYVTSLLKGEFKSVPDTCKVLPAATLRQYLPGPASTVQPSDTATSSECSFTMDSKPNFLVLTISAQSYQPFPAATGNGSASQNALDAFTTAKALLIEPPKHAPLPKAVISPLPGLGQQAYVGVQVGHTGGIKRDVATVSVLDRNAIITVTMSGQESGGFGPVAVGTLQAEARAVAGLILAQELTQPKA
jgi:hypothetical protein